MQAELSRALALDESAPVVISLVGGGGKTTAMFRLADELKARGKRVLVTTTTNIFVPGPGRCDRYFLDGCDGADALAGSPAGTITCLGNGIIEGEHRKVKSVDPACIDGISSAGHFDCILVEADGSKRKPIKAPADYEPVIPSSTTAVIGVIGLDALGKPIDEETVHRSGLFCSLTGSIPGDTLGPEDIIKLIRADAGLFKNAPGAAEKIVLLNKADTDALLQQAQLISRGLAGPPAAADGCIAASLQQQKIYTLL